MPPDPGGRLEPSPARPPTAVGAASSRGRPVLARFAGGALHGCLQTPSAGVSAPALGLPPLLGRHPRAAVQCSPASRAAHFADPSRPRRPARALPRSASHPRCGGLPPPVPPPPPPRAAPFA